MSTDTPRLTAVWEAHLRNELLNTHGDGRLKVAAARCLGSNAPLLLAEIDTLRLALRRCAEVADDARLVRATVRAALGEGD